MRSVILEDFQNALLESVDDFLKKTLQQKSLNNIYELGKQFSKAIQTLKSVIRAADDPISLHINTMGFLTYKLGGLSGLLPWCNEYKLKSSINAILNEENYSIFP